jgi:hypothetical protein
MKDHRRSERKTAHGRGRAALASVWKKPVIWFSGIVVAALGIAITNVLVPRFGEGLNWITQEGDAVIVNDIHVHQNGGTYMAFPSNVHISDDEATEVGTGPDQWPWFTSRGAVRVGHESIRLTVTGNRQKGVRIMDLTPVKECHAPLNGAYFESPSAGGSTSLALFMDLDDPQPQAMDKPSKIYGGSILEEKPRAYFESNTVSLSKDEQFVFVLNVRVDESFCSFEIEMSILEDNAVHKQRINNDGQPFSLTAQLSRSSWEHAYVGGITCKTGAPQYVPAAEPWFEGNDGYPC